MLQTASKLLGSVIVVLAAQPAFATGPVPVPAPDVGAGLPGLLIVGGVLGAIWLTRMRSRRRAD